MPLSRRTVANEYALGGPELYKGVDQRDPEAVLDGVAMAGLVGVLRQLGDLAEFAAEVFHGLYDEVMTASARGHGLVLRVQQLEAELPLLEKDICQRDYLYVASNRGIDWHANTRVDHGVVTTGDTPRFIMNSIKQCHGPPRLFMLDKYDIGGEGTCLKRYSDPAFFKTDSACARMLQEGIRTERRPIRTMEIRPNLQNAEIFRPPDGANDDSKFKSDLSSEVLDEAPTRRQRLKYRQLNGSLFRSFRPLMQDLYEKASPEEKTFSMDQSETQVSFSDSPDTNAEERDIMVDTSSSIGEGKDSNFTTFHKIRTTSEETPSSCSEDRSAGSSKGYNSETDVYVDALTTMGSELETDSEHKDHGQRTFTSASSGKMWSDAHGAAVSRSSTFNKEEDSPMPCSSDVGSEDEDVADHYDEDVSVNVPHAKPVAGEHERTSSLEELFEQEKPVSCEHERTHSLEELLAGDVLVSEPDIRELATEFNANSIIGDATPDGTVDTTKKAKANNISSITFKKMASKRCVEGMELFASKVGILPRKVSKRHDPFSDSLRNMAKELLELKCDGTQDTDLYDYEANSEVFDVRCREMPHSPVEIKGGSFRQSISSDSHQDDVGSTELQPEESDLDVPPTESPQDSVPDEDVFQQTHVHLTTSPSAQEKEGCAGAALDEDSCIGMLDHAPELIQEQTEDIHAEVLSENASNMSEELKEACICEENVNEEDAKECSESDEYASDDETEEYIGEDMVPSPVSSKQSDDPFQVTPFTPTDADDTIASEDGGDVIVSEGTDNYIPETEHITLLETITETELPQDVPELAISSEVAVPDNVQCYLHPETSFAPDTVLSSREVVGQNEKLQLCSSSSMTAGPDLTINTEQIHELNQEPPSACNTEYFADRMAPDSRHVPLPNISSFDWMLSGAMRQSLNVFPAQTSHGILQENRSSEDTEHAPPLPPLPPMQWRATKLQTGSTSLFAKLGKPPRPPVKHKESDSNSAGVETHEEPGKLKEKSLHNSFTSQKEMAQPEVSDEILTNPFLDRDSQEDHLQEGCQESDVRSFNLFSAPEVKSVTDVASVEGDSLNTLQLPELIVIPEEAWSELAVDIEPIMQQEKARTQELRDGVSDCDGMQTTVLPIEKTKVEHERSDQKKKELPAGDSNTISDSEENKPNVLSCKDDIQTPDLSAQQEDGGHGSSDDKAREFSSALEQELAKLPSDPVPEPPKYPLLQVISHDRSMLRKAPTLVQPSRKLSDEKNTMLEQIKNKSINLKPVVAKRPNVMGGPRTNLQVAAILERANAIRQAVADDDDEDSWSE
ncbi:uncharacterized protein [Lolium perenne]|uniref:uncharacterized protein isoform X2 n=1 Tax=Lolium perenne TaxID=4522 RepID=UPI0021F5524B|nr:protein SCAR2-like isoform X2 [Lolium perenne]